MRMNEIAKFTKKDIKTVSNWIKSASKEHYEIKEKVDASKKISEIDFLSTEVIKIMKFGRWGTRTLNFLKAAMRSEYFIKENPNNKSKYGCYACYYGQKENKDGSRACIHPDNVVDDFDPWDGPRKAINDKNVSKKWNKDGNCERFKMGTIEAFK